MPKTKIKSIILFTAMVLVFSGCGRELGIKNEELGIKDSGEMGGLVEQVATTTGEDLGVASSPDDFNSFEVIDEENGWKKYVNRKVGIEFRFLDKKNVINVESRFSKIDNEHGTGQIVLDDGEKQWLYIDFNTREIYGRENQGDFEKFLNNEGMFNHGIVYKQTIIERNNDNNLKYYEVLTDQLPDTLSRIKQQERVVDKNYVFEYNIIYKQIDVEDSSHGYCYIQYFSLNGDDKIMNDVMRSFSLIR